jgi:hypothetical protein
LEGGRFFCALLKKSLFKGELSSRILSSCLGVNAVEALRIQRDESVVSTGKNGIISRLIGKFINFYLNSFLNG